MRKSFSVPRRIIERRGHADLGCDQALVQIVDGGNGLALEAENGVAHLHAGQRRRAAWLDLRHRDAALRGQLMKADHAGMQRHVLPGHADGAAPDALLLDQPGRDELRRIARDGKADALRRAG